MQIDVDGTRLWFDIDGPALVPDGSEMQQRPTVVLVHGGPGVYDHSGDAAAWSLETCADDVRSFCDTLGIDMPIVFVHSMGAPIVLLYGARHPGHAGLIVQSGFARWSRLGWSLASAVSQATRSPRSRGGARRGMGSRLCRLRPKPSGH